MKLFLLLFCALCFKMQYSVAQDKVIDLWPDGPPHENGLSGPEVDEGNNRISNISVPQLYLYMPEKKNNTGVAVIMCPGGAYRREAMSHEGWEIGEWLKSKGITGAVLKYRLPNGHPEIPLEDAQQAIRILRLHAEEWGIDPAKVGIGGASAGGHLAVTAGTQFEAGDKSAEDPAKHFSTRPDFMLLLYPVVSFKDDSALPDIRDRLVGPGADWETVKKYCSDFNVTADTPPAFLVFADNDNLAVLPGQAIEFYQAMRRHGVHAEMHMFLEGGHGFGITKQNLPVDQWPQLFYDWLIRMGFVKG